MVLNNGINLILEGLSYPLSSTSFSQVIIQEEAFGALPTVRLIVKELKQMYEIKIQEDLSIQVIYDEDLKYRGVFVPISDKPKTISLENETNFDERVFDLVLKVDKDPKSFSTNSTIEKHLSKMGVDTNTSSKDKSLFLNTNRPNHIHFRDVADSVQTKNGAVWSITSNKKVIRDYNKSINDPKAKISVRMNKRGYFYASDIEAVPNPIAKATQDIKLDLKDKSNHDKTVTNGNTPPIYSNGQKDPEIFSNVQKQRFFRTNLSQNIKRIWVNQTFLAEVLIGDAVTIYDNGEESNYIVLKKMMVLDSNEAKTELIVSRIEE